MSPLPISISILHLCLPLQPHPMIVDHSLQPFSELERDGGHHKTLVRHKLCLPFLPGCDLPGFSKLNSRSSQNVKPVFSLHSLNDILVISIFWFWLTPGGYHYQRKSQDQVMGGFKVFKVLPVCVDKSNNVRLVSKLCFDLGHLSSLSLDSINQSISQWLFLQQSTLRFVFVPPCQTWHCCPQSRTPPSLDAVPPLSEQCLHIGPEKRRTLSALFFLYWFGC